MIRRYSIVIAMSLLLGVRLADAQTAVTTAGGTTNAMPVFTSSTTLGNSVINQSGSNIGIGTASPSSLLHLFSPASNPQLTIQTTYSGPNTLALLFTDPNASGSIASSWWGNGMTFTTPRDITQSGFHFVSNGGTEVVHIDTNTKGVAIGSPFANTTLDPPSNGLIVSGSVGIGTTAPGAKLEVDGNVTLTSGSGSSITFADGTAQTTAWTGVLCGGDYAEAMNADGGRKKYEPGDVLVLAAGDNSDVQKSAEPYSTMVAGIFATKPGVIGKREALAKSADDIPMAMVGVVPTKVSAENGAIHKGDLLVSSSTPGYAMKGTDRSRMLGAVIGKAMGTLDSGAGEIEVLITLQ